ncbi:MAG TPA: bifunctional 4-hydroxy-2-oxoglutarate aldolase/2-dehydro-3-deoxy-phosphogluconate aldolase [Streptosporangiaceae bacterium]|nr:bifunctional 4-hydroxy-2-oxoglutarate aldolase/2-dehydro-3-deoxy-phosphogluconate aldolase [Streptosporangiaceae bacterium]
MYRWEICAEIASARVLGVLRTPSGKQAVELGEALVQGGLRVIEVALTTPDGLDAIHALHGTNDGRLVGAGTVLDAPSARAAILAGARFLVSPSFIPEVIVTGHRYGVPVLPGTQTPSEIQRALEAGSDMVKVFPASQLGPGFVSGVVAALPQAPLVPTGGVNPGNARDWLAAGAVAVGVGGSLTSGDPAQARERAAQLVAAIGKA